MTMDKTNKTEPSARETIITLLAQALSKGTESTLDEDVARKWAEALVTLYDRQVQDAGSAEMLNLWAAARATRRLHEKIYPDAGKPYCDVCANHGDINWPCATIRALDTTEK